MFDPLQFRDVVQSLEQANARRRTSNSNQHRLRRVSLQPQPSSASLHTISHPDEYQNPHLSESLDAESDEENLRDTESSETVDNAPPVYPQPQDHLERQLDAGSLSAISKISSRLASALRPIMSRLPAINVDLPELDKVLLTLFPSMIKFGKKPFYSKISAILSAPVIFLLTVTLPIVTEDSLSSRRSGGVHLDDDSEAIVRNMYDDDILVDLDPSSTSSEWQRWLTVTHLLLSSLFSSLVLATLGVAPASVLIPIFVSVGAVLSVLLVLTTSAYKRPPLFWMMCFVGFIIAVLWIYIIANEVVGVLQTIGFALGISDAILGLTVFAMVGISYYMFVS